MNLQASPKFFIDPPSGWRYGFPKEYPRPLSMNYDSVKLWLIENGYPKSEIKIFERKGRSLPYRVLRG